MDEIVVDLMSEWIRRYNLQWNDTLSRDVITHWEVHRFTKPESGTSIYSILSDSDLFRDLAPTAGAVDAVTELHEAGYDVRFATAAPTIESLTPKGEWMEEHFGHLNFSTRNLITLSDKVWLAPSVDVLVDDKPATIAQWRSYADQAGPTGPKIFTIAQPYNQHMRNTAHLFAESYLDTEAAWSTIVSGIHELSWSQRKNIQRPIIVDYH